MFLEQFSARPTRQEMLNALARLERSAAREIDWPSTTIGEPVRGTMVPESRKSALHPGW